MSAADAASAMARGNQPDVARAVADAVRRSGASALASASASS